MDHGSKITIGDEDGNRTYFVENTTDGSSVGRVEESYTEGEGERRWSWCVSLTPDCQFKYHRYELTSVPSPVDGGELVTERENFLNLILSLCKCLLDPHTDFTIAIR